MDEATTPGLVERVDHLTATVADMAFKLETLISSTTAFRESFGERMTDYADLVAHWSIETEENLGRQRAMSERLVSDLHRAVDAMAENLGDAVGKAERRVLEAVEAAAPEPVQPPPPVDLGPVLAELAALRESVPAPEPVDLGPVVAELAALREDLPTVDLGPLAEEVRGLRRDLARLPDDAGHADALAAVLAEVTAARQELPGVVDAIVPPPVDIASVADEVRQLREALLAEAGAAEEDDTSLAEAVGEQLTALRAEMHALQDRVAERPPVPPEVEALTAELQALRREMEGEPPEAEPVAAPTGLDPVLETLAELVYEVKALRRRFPVKAPAGEAEPSAHEPPPVPPKRGPRKPR